MSQTLMRVRKKLEGPKLGVLKSLYKDQTRKKKKYLNTTNNIKHNALDNSTAWKVLDMFELFSKQSV